MEVRPSLIILLVLSALTWAIAGDTWGPDSVGSTPSRPPVQVAGRVSPSPRPSPGGIQYVAVDSTGAVAVNGTVTASLSAGNIGVTSNAGGGMVNVTLPSASPVPVQFGTTGSVASGSHSAVSVDTTSTGTEVIASNSTMRGWLVQNADTATGAYIGLGSVSSANGYYLAPGATLGLDMVGGYNGQVKAISASGTISIRRVFW